ncbi:MAG TPA: hypothetical protein VFT99_08490, partial [Roseiflexaceae bacterium]|nr:hypothetical protein [Roseiflexaceae bacterium]
TVLPNQQITFSHTLTNGGPTATGGYSIGWNTETGPSASGPWSYGGLSGNAGTFSAGQTKTNIGNQLITVPANAVPNSQICMRLYWSPDNHNGGYEWSAPRCATVQYNYSLTPNINVAVTGVDGPVTGNFAEPGDSATFTYAVNNTGTTQSQTVTCTYTQATHAGFSTAAPTTPFIPSGANCAPSRVFPVGNTPVATETVNNLPANSSVCRALGVGPASFGNSMPSGWSSADIGAVGIAGSTSVSGSTFTVQASGADVWDTVDEFRYTYRSFSGNFDFQARVASVSNTDPWTKAGIMARNTTANNSSHAFALVSPANGTAFQRRTATGGFTSHTAGPVAAAPYWVRLVRSGNSFTAYTSSNGSSWTNVGSETISMNASINIGLALVSHNDGALAQAVFDSVSINGAPVSTGTQTSAQSCVHVASKPYARVYGGDVSAGGGLVTSPDTPTDCSLSPWAAVIGWNRRAAGGWSGAGVQFATYAMRNIFDTATGLGAGSGAPHTVAFANTGITPTVSTANGRFGGMFGSAACVQDHYATQPVPAPPSLTSPFTLTGLGSGSYSATGNVRLTASTINPSEKVTLYVDGNLYIDGNQRYAGSGTWNSANIPLLRIIVLGNIFIDNDVQFLDGLYVAQQRDSTTDGIIYTCTSGTAPGP